MLSHFSHVRFFAILWTATSQRRDGLINRLFLYSTYKQYHISVWLTSSSVRISRSVHIVAMALLYSFYIWAMFCFIYVPHLLYPFFCWWIFRWHPCPGYCVQNCNEHWGTSIFSNYLFSGHMPRSEVAGSHCSSLHPPENRYRYPPLPTHLLKMTPATQSATSERQNCFLKKKKKKTAFSKGIGCFDQGWWAFSGKRHFQNLGRGTKSKHCPMVMLSSNKVRRTSLLGWLWSCLSPYCFPRKAFIPFMTHLDSYLYIHLLVYHLLTPNHQLQEGRIHYVQFTNVTPGRGHHLAGSRCSTMPFGIVAHSVFIDGMNQLT